MASPEFPYEVNGRGYRFFSEAVAAAQAAGVNVYEVRASGERLQRWSPAPKKTVTKARHVLITPTGEVPFSRVRQR